jgi:hypothetical protein
MLAKGQKNTRADVSVIAVLLVVGLVVASAASLLVVVSDFGVPEPEYSPLDDETSPFAVEYAEGTLAGSPDETALYDSTTGDVSEYGFEGRDASPPPVDEGVRERIEDLEGSSEPPNCPSKDEVNIPPGDYYVDSDVNWWGPYGGDCDVTFDTTGRPVRIAVEEAGDISAIDATFNVDGGNPVEFYVQTSNPAIGNDFLISDATFENHRTGAFRVYARSSGEDSTDVKFEDTEFRGIVYAPGTSVEFEDSTVHGASIAEETRLDGSSYYHDTQVERLGTEVLPGADTDDRPRTDVFP